MLALARALMLSPRLLLLDEPSLGLAPIVVTELFGIVRRLNEEEGLAVLVVEQNANLALAAAQRAVRARGGHRGGRGTERRAARARGRPPELPRLLMEEFFQQIVSGLASGGIYASLALALVLIYRATGVVNFAQGEMAMFSTFVAWSLMEQLPYWPAFVLTLVLAFIGGAAIELTLIRPVMSASPLTVVIVTIGLLIGLNGLARRIWGNEPRTLESPFSTDPVRIGGVAFSLQDLGIIAVSLAIVALLWAFFRFTKLGLGLRAAATNPAESRLVGIRVAWMLALGWGLAAVLGAVAGMMAAPPLGSFDQNLMQPILLYAFAAAVLGGIDSAIGAVVGGLLVGVMINLIGTYVDFVGADLRLPVALTIILAVLLVRPAGLFGREAVRRV